MLELARHLKLKGHKITIYTQVLNSSRCYPDLLSDLKVVFLRKPLPWSFPRTKFKLIKVVRYFINFLKSSINALRLVFLIDKDSDIINPHLMGVLETTWVFKLLHPKVKISWFCNEIPIGETNYLESQNINLTKVLKKLRCQFEIILYKFLLKKVDTIAVNDNRNKHLLKEIFNKKAVNVGTGVDINKFHPLQSIRNRNNLKILSVGVLFPYRRYEDLISAVGMVLKRNFNISVTIVGNPILYPAYAQRLHFLVKRKRLIDYIQFIDSVNEQKIIELYQGHDIFIWPCDRNTYGLAVIEAMACGLPVIVSNTTGVAEILEENKTALIIPPQRPDLLADKIIFLINNPEKRIKIGKNAREFVENNLTWENFTTKMEKLFLSS